MGTRLFQKFYFSGPFEMQLVHIDEWPYTRTFACHRVRHAIQRQTAVGYIFHTVSSFPWRLIRFSSSAVIDAFKSWWRQNVVVGTAACLLYKYLCTPSTAAASAIDPLLIWYSPPASLLYGPSIRPSVHPADPIFLYLYSPTPADGLAGSRKKIERI